MENHVKENKPMVSVCMVTYNHAPYIAQAIEGVLLQQTDFKIELVIGYDCSTDNTRKICIDYRDKYPDIINLLLPTERLGVTANFLNTIQQCTGKYIALCDGDDFWTDPQKLQKQIQVLEQNESYSVCMHHCLFYYEKDKSTENKPYPSYLADGHNGFSFSYADWIKEWFGATLTWVFRKDRFPDMQIVAKYDTFIDMHVLYYTMKNHKGYYLKDNMATYRVHSKGVWSGQSKEMQIKADIRFYYQIYSNEKDRYTKYRYTKAIEDLLYLYYKEKRYFKCLLTYFLLGWKCKTYFFRFTKPTI